MMPHLRNPQGGFTLLEALITIVIVSIGLLGLLGLQTLSLANTQISSARSEATTAADNMADRIRANPTGAAAADYDKVAHPAAGNAPKACTGGTVCTPAEMATYDAWEWDQSLGHDLPDGRGYVDCTQTNTVTGTGCQNYKITVVWHERDRSTDTTPPDLCPSRTDITDRCFQTELRP